MRKVLTIAAALLISSAANAKPDVERVIEMPVDGMMAIVDDSGKITLATPNGRYVIQGQIFDTWLGHYLDTGDAIKDSAHRLPLQRIGINSDELGALTIGETGKVVTIFTDPICGACAKTIDEVKEIAKKGEYQFKILVVPALGDKSSAISKNIACETDREAALNAMLSHTPAIIPNAPKDCNDKTYQKLLTTAQTISVDSVPFIISEEGRVMRGKPASIEQWLNAGN